MNKYIVKMCKIDGTTPLGECPEFEIFAKGLNDARNKICIEHPEYEIVSWDHADNKWE
jgi:hypothetical protein